MLISIVVPCFNEQDVIETLDARTRDVLNDLEGPDAGYELCYVDDGSSDSTLNHLRVLTRAHAQNTRYVSFSRNFGKEAAILAGPREARGDVVILVDADLQHPPELIEQMLALHRRGYDQVVARRTRDGDGLLRTMASKAYYRLVKRMAHVNINDGEGDFRLLSRTAVDALLSLPEYYRFSKGLFSWIGFKSVTFDYRNVAREAGASKWRFTTLLEYGIDGVLSFNNRLLRLGLYFGLLLAGVAVAYAAWIVVAALMIGVRTPGYATLLVAVVGLGGLQISMLGLIGEYLGRTYVEAKRRPHFLIKETSESLDDGRVMAGKEMPWTGSDR